MKEHPHLLIVDDEQVVLDSVKKLCSAEGWWVDTALDAREGLKKISKKTYDLIICDIMLPEMDGFQCLEEIDKMRLHTPVIIITGYSTVANAVKSLTSGAIDFLAKPFTVDELISTISRGLNYSRIVNLNRPGKSVDDSSVSFVSCPPAYYCLGYAQWANRESDGTVKIGVTDLYLRTIENISAIELMETNEEVIQGNPCAGFRTEGGLVHTVLSPVSGKIVERNEKLLEKINLILKDPFFEGWLYMLIPSFPDYEFNNLNKCDYRNV